MCYYILSKYALPLLISVSLRSIIMLNNDVTRDQSTTKSSIRFHINQKSIIRYS